MYLIFLKDSPHARSLSVSTDKIVFIVTFPIVFLILPSIAFAASIDICCPTIILKKSYKGIICSL